MCEGFFDNELREWKRVRALGWIVQCGYADPKKMPANQMEWWPMQGDVIPKPVIMKMTKAKKSKIADLIKKQIGG